MQNTSKNIVIFPYFYSLAYNSNNEFLILRLIFFYQKNYTNIYDLRNTVM